MNHFSCHIFWASSGDYPFLAPFNPCTLALSRSYSTAHHYYYHCSTHYSYHVTTTTTTNYNYRVWARSSTGAIPPMRRVVRQGKYTECIHPCSYNMYDPDTPLHLQCQTLLLISYTAAAEDNSEDGCWRAELSHACDPKVSFG